jgi:hypothetical protein
MPVTLTGDVAAAGVRTVAALIFFGASRVGGFGMGESGFTKIAVSGFTSEVVKTTLVCELLPFLSGWEAIKMTRGHYRSCGKDPQACCVSHLLGDQPLINSGRGATYAPGKDTGRYWDAGAANVHWVVVTSDQVEAGIKLALDRVRGPGVLIEGNSFLQTTPVDFSIMVARAEGGKIKTSAQRLLSSSSALYVMDLEGDPAVAEERFMIWSQSSTHHEQLARLPLYSRATLPQMLDRIRTVHQSRARKLSAQAS